MSYTDGSGSIQTINPDGTVPETRMKGAREVQDYVRKLYYADQKRAAKRARLQGLVDGNPPYLGSKLVAAGRADACNVNWGVARSYMESGVGAFYDLFQEAPTYLTITTSHGETAEQKQEYSRIITEEADRIMRNDKVWDYNISLSIDNMVLQGCGPMLFEDSEKVLPRGVACGDLKVPDFTKSDTTYWDAAILLVTYFPPELYKFISEPKSATAVGWNVEYTKKVIEHAMDIRQPTGIPYDWEFYQQQLKNNSFYYYDNTKVCRTAHVFWKEFDGTISQGIVVRDSAAGVAVEYMYFHRGRYRNWQEAVHPMYYDHGNGGFHHSVTGLGVKMYSAMDYQNRLLCNLADKAFSPKILFKPTSTESAQKFEMQRLGDFAVLKGNWDWQQTGVAGLMNDGLAMNEELTKIVSSNLSSYRQPLQTEKRGNPKTAYETSLNASMQSALSKTQFNRYYKQLDLLYAEIYRRLSNLNSSDERAKEFQKRCHDRNVPREAIGRVESVLATRVVGQGSAFMRRQALNDIWMTYGAALPEDGRDALISDGIASQAGQSAVERYYPRRQTQLATDQQSEAAQWVGLMKTGVPPVVTSSQNPVTFAATFLNAGVQAMTSLQQGGNPMEVYKFLSICGPAIAAQLQRFAADPTRAPLFKAMQAQWQKLAALTDQLKAQLQQNMQQQQAQQQKQQQVMTDEQLAAAQTQNDIQLKNAKTQAQLKQSADKHALAAQSKVQDMALKDAAAAAAIRREHAKAQAQINKPEPATA